MNNPRGQNTIPVSEGQEVDVTIESIGEKGDGVAKVKGFVVFVTGVSKGERCKIRIKKVMKSVSFGEKIGPATTAEPERPVFNKPKTDEFDGINLDDLGEGSEDFGEEL